MEKKMEQNNLFELKNVSVIYGGQNKVKALSDLSLTIHTGEQIAIVGPSGAGKSTLLSVLSGLEKITDGNVVFRGESLYKMKEKALSDVRLKNFGFVFQAFHLISNMVVYDNIVLPAMTAYGSVDKEWFGYLVEELQIKERLSHKPNQLSGGEKQRVAIARALINKPDVLFADEPSGNLDTKNGNAVFDLLFHYVRKNNKTLIYVTHDMEKADLAERQIIIKDGVICK